MHSTSLFHQLCSCMCTTSFALLVLLHFFFSCLQHLISTPVLVSIFLFSFLLTCLHFSYFLHSSSLPPSMSPYAVSGSFTWLEERKGEDPASLNYTCSPDAQIQVGPTACLPCGFSAFVSVASLYM